MCNSICEGGNFTYIELPYFYGTRCILIFPNNLRKLVLYTKYSNHCFRILNLNIQFNQHNTYLLWIWPDQITECTLVWNLLVPLDEPDLVQGPDVRRQSSMDTENLTVNEGGHCEHVEHFTTISPHVAVTILILTFIVETINLQKYINNTNIHIFSVLPE